MSAETNAANADVIDLTDSLDDLGAMWFSRELEENGIIGGNHIPTESEIANARRDALNGNFQLGDLAAEDLRRFAARGPDAQRLIDAAIAAEKLGGRGESEAEIQQRGIGGIFAESPLGWEEGVQRALEERFGEPLRDPVSGGLIGGKDVLAVWHVGSDAYKLIRLWDGHIADGLEKQIILNVRFGDRYAGDVVGGGTFDGKPCIVVKQPWVESGTTDRRIVKAAIDRLIRETGLERAPDGDPRAEDGYVNEYSLSPNLRDERFIFTDLNINQNYFVDEEGGIRIIDADVEPRQVAGNAAAEDAAYMDAVKRGDMETAQRMVREAAARRMKRPVVVYKNTRGEFFIRRDADRSPLFFSDDFDQADSYYSRTINKITSTKVDWTKIASESQLVKAFQNVGIANELKRVEAVRIDNRQHWLSPSIAEEIRKGKWGADKDGRQQLVHDNIEQVLSWRGELGWENIKKAAILAAGENTGAYVIDVDGFVEIDAKGRRWDDLSDVTDGKWGTTNEIADYSKENGIGFIIKNVKDTVVGNGEQSFAATDYIVPQSVSIKSAEPVTYDDAGNVIPLSQRFNPAKNDVRWFSRELEGGSLETPQDIRRAINRSSLSESAKAQMHAVLKAYRNRDNTFKRGFLKAPNGNPSHLDAWKWLVVRTSNYRDNFFGDWLNLLRGKRLRTTAAIQVAKSKIPFSKPDKSAIKSAVDWIEKMGVQTFQTEVGDVLFDRKSVKDSLEHYPFTQAKYDAVFSIPQGFGNAVYLGTMDDFEGNTITNHYFAYPVIYDGKRQIVFCRTRENADRSALYVHDIFVESDITNGASVLPPDITALKAETAQGVYRDSELMRNILKIVYAVKPSDVSKVVDENDEPLVVWHSTDAEFTRFERQKAKWNANTTGLHWFAAEKDYSSQYGKNVRPFFLNIRNMAELGDIDQESDAENLYALQDKSGVDFGEDLGVDIDSPDEHGYPLADFTRYASFADALTKHGVDGVSAMEGSPVEIRVGGEKVTDEAVHKTFGVVNSSQAKSATDNNGDFSGNDDTRWFSRELEEDVIAPDQLSESATSTSRPRRSAVALSRTLAVSGGNNRNIIPIPVAEVKRAIAKFRNGDESVRTGSLPDTLRDLGKIFKLKYEGRSRYATYEARIGNVVLRLSDHNAYGKNFQEHEPNANRYVSVYIDRATYPGMPTPVAYEEIRYPLDVFESKPDAVVVSIVDGVSDVLDGKPYTVNPALGEKKEYAPLNPLATSEEAQNLEEPRSESTATEAKGYKPKKTRKMFKLFRKYADGTYGALFIDSANRLVPGEWYKAAEDRESAGACGCDAGRCV